MTCEHKHQKWRFDMRSGSCSDCGVRLIVHSLDGSVHEDHTPPPAMPVTLSGEQATRLYEILQRQYHIAHHSIATDERRRLCLEGMGMLPIPQKGT